MKMNKKKLVSLSLVVIMIAILSFSSLAWFSDSDSVTNNFTVAGGTGNPEDVDKIFSLDVMELIDEDGDGVADATIGYDQDPNYIANYTYEKILPGDMLYKRPSARNTGAYDQYIRFKVTIDNANDWVAVMQKYGYELHDLLYVDSVTKLTKSPDWTFVPEQTTVENDKVTYVFYYNYVMKPGENAVLFTYVKIPHELTQQDMALFAEGKFQMVVTGEAVQTENIKLDDVPVTTAKDAFTVVEQTQTIG